MELWNLFMSEQKWRMFDINENYSLEDVLKIRFRVKFSEENHIDCGTILEEEMEEDLSNNHFVEQDVYYSFVDKESYYIGNELKKLYQMLDIMVGKENRKKISLYRNEKVFTPSNCEFFAFILETYHIKDSKEFRKGKYHQVSTLYLNHIYKGMMNLAINPKVNLKINIVDQRWNTEFEKKYRDFLDYYDEFQHLMGLFIQEVLQRDDRDILLGKIGALLQKCLHGIALLDTPLLDIYCFYDKYEKYNE